MVVIKTKQKNPPGNNSVDNLWIVVLEVEDSNHLHLNLKINGKCTTWGDRALL